MVPEQTNEGKATETRWWACEILQPPNRWRWRLSADCPRITLPTAVQRRSYQLWTTPGNDPSTTTVSDDVISGTLFASSALLCTVPDESRFSSGTPFSSALPLRQVFPEHVVPRVRKDSTRSGVQRRVIKDVYGLIYWRTMMTRIYMWYFINTLSVLCAKSVNKYFNKISSSVFLHDKFVFRLIYHSNECILPRWCWKLWEMGVLTRIVVWPDFLLLQIHKVRAYTFGIGVVAHWFA